MEPPTTLVKTFKYTSPQQPMFRVLEPPLHYRAPSVQNKFEDISFSSYLKPKSEAAPAAEDTEISIFDAQKYFSENSDPMRKQQMQLQQEMSQHEMTRLSSVSSADGGYARNFRARSFHATPTVSSEASWNSQTGLLANPPGSVGVSLRNMDGSSKKRSSVARKWIFGRKCCCTGKKSVDIKEGIASDSEHGGPTMTSENNNNGKGVYYKRDLYKAKASNRNSDVIQQEDEFPAPDPPRQQRISASGVPFVDGAGGFSFPILNASTKAVAKPVLKGIITKVPIINNPMEDPPRDSLEVFQPNQELFRPSDNPVRPDFRPGSPIARVVNSTTDDDNASDASSDLFEIESFSTQTTSYPMYRRRDSFDEAPTFNARRFASANGLNLNTTNSNSNIQYGRRSLDEPPTPSVAATECYAPSEVSIDWSVTTAEGFDRASVSNFSISASEVGTAAFLRQRLQQQQEEAAGDSGRRKGSGGGGGLLLMSCRQEKAVSVGPQPVKCVSAAEGPAAMFPVHHGQRRT